MSMILFNKGTILTDSRVNVRTSSFAENPYAAYFSHSVNSENVYRDKDNHVLVAYAGIVAEKTNTDEIDILINRFVEELKEIESGKTILGNGKAGAQNLYCPTVIWNYAFILTAKNGYLIVNDQIAGVLTDEMNIGTNRFLPKNQGYRPVLELYSYFRNARLTPEKAFDLLVKYSPQAEYPIHSYSQSSLAPLVNNV